VSKLRTSSPISPTIFGTRLREARLRREIPQDKLGVLIGLDEQTASARISRYENGIHEPPIQTACLIAAALQVPLAYLYCDDDMLASIVLAASKLSASDQGQLLLSLQERIDPSGVTR
jgi:transcriptional regulator with XRE-family HTH domain